MKRKLNVAFISCILILFVSTSMIVTRNTNLSNAEAQIALIKNQSNTKEPKEQIYYNLFITMLYPYVNEAIDNYYDEYMTYLPGEAPYSYKFVKIEKTPGLNYSYTIVLEVLPYVGPHLSVGLDRITFKIDLNGVKVEKFEHIESYDLPPNYQNILKKKLPNTKINTPNDT